MFIEHLLLANFRCFGPQPTTIQLSRELTAFVGVNGSGKTAVMQCLQRLFGVTADQRRLRRQDFHIPSAEENGAQQRSLIVEAIIAFPELDEGGDPSAVPEFFQHMAADDAGRLKCRLRLQATWTDDGTLDGAIEQSYRAVRTFGEFAEEDCIELKANDRARIQMIYVPATRDGASQVTAFLRGRLWRAINWSQQVKDTLSTAGAAMNAAFDGEAAVSRITAAVRERWQQMHTAGTDTTPIFRPVDARWQELIRNRSGVRSCVCPAVSLPNVSPPAHRIPRRPLPRHLPR